MREARKDTTMVTTTTMTTSLGSMGWGAWFVVCGGVDDESVSSLENMLLASRGGFNAILLPVQQV